MEPLYITLIAVFGTAILIFATLFVLAFVLNKKVFGARHDKNPLLKYYTAEDFNLSATQVDISCVKNQYVRGVIYKKDGVSPKNELVIFCHGMGPGHIAYTTEIAYFCNLGYTVLAPDYYGSGLSDGKNLKSNLSALKSVKAAIYYSKENLSFNKTYLIGHSWGAYSALCAASDTGLVDAVVAMSAPDKSEKIMHNSLCRRIPRFFANLWYPFLCLVCGGDSAGKAADRISPKIPILLIHGDKDPLVPLEISAYAAAKGDHVTKYLAKEKRHNPYNTVSAEKKLSELLKAMSKHKKGEVGEEFFKTFDYAASTEEDAEVMGEIARFLSKN